MYNIINTQFGNIDLNIFGQIFRQTGDIEFCHQWGKNAFFNLHSRGFIDPLEMQRNFHVQLFSCLYPLKVDMHQPRLKSMALNLAQNHLL